MRDNMNMTQVAAELGISVSQVSRALSGNGRVSEKTRKRVLEYLEQHKMNPNQRSVTYRNNRTGLIGIVIPGEGNALYQSYYQELLNYLHDYFSVRDYKIMLIKANDDYDIRIKEIVNKHLVDGLVLTFVSSKEKEIQYLHECQVPFVVIGSVSSSAALQVTPDYENGAYDLVNALVYKGARKFAFACRNSESFMEKSVVRGMNRSYMKHYLLLDRKLIFSHADSFNYAQRIAEQCVKEKVDYILCADEEICLMLMKSLKITGIHLSDSMKVASIQNGRIISEYISNISCLSFDYKLIASEAGSLLCKKINDEKIEKENIIIGYELIMKDTSMK